VDSRKTVPSKRKVRLVGSVWGGEYSCSKKGAEPTGKKDTSALSVWGCGVSNQTRRFPRSTFLTSKEGPPDRGGGGG